MLERWRTTISRHEGWEGRGQVPQVCGGAGLGGGAGPGGMGGGRLQVPHYRSVGGEQENPNPLSHAHLNSKPKPT